MTLEQHEANSRFRYFMLLFSILLSFFLEQCAGAIDHRIVERELSCIASGYRTVYVVAGDSVVCQRRQP